LIPPKHKGFDRISGRFEIHQSSNERLKAKMWPIGRDFLPRLSSFLAAKFQPCKR
jgi:hypothetical protein